MKYTLENSSQNIKVHKLVIFEYLTTATLYILVTSKSTSYSNCCTSKSTNDVLLHRLKVDNLIFGMVYLINVIIIEHVMFEKERHVFSSFRFTSLYYADVMF